MKETLFENEVFDYALYHSTKSRFTELAEYLPLCLQALREEGLPTTMEFFMTITESDESFSEYLTKLRERQMKDLFMPVDERMRIIESYSDLHDRLRDSFRKLRRIRVERLPLLAEGDAIIADYNQIESISKKKATIRINVRKLNDYYLQVKKIIDAMAELREFQTKNGLPDVLNGELTRNNGRNISRYNLQMLIDEGFTPELFAEVAQDHVTLKSK